MKNLKNVDFVQAIQITGTVLTLFGSIATSIANDKKLDKTIDDKVSKAIAKQLAEINFKQE